MKEKFCKFILRITDNFSSKRLILFILGLTFVFCVLTVTGTTTGIWGWEHTLYYRIYGQISSGQIPYVDFFIEYPPLAVYFISLPWAFFTGITQNWFATLYSFYAMVWFASALIGMKWILRKLNANVDKSKQWIFFTGILMLPVFILIVARYDIFPAVLCAIGFGLYLVSVRNKNRLFFAVAILLISISAVLKLYGFLILPLIFLNEFFDKKYLNSVITFLIIIFCIGVNIPFVLNGQDRFNEFLKYQTQRDVQVESSYSTVFLLAEKIGIAKTDLEIQYGALEIVNNYTNPVGKISQAAIILSSVGIYCIFIFLKLKRKVNIQSTLILLSISVVLAFIFFNKVFSPQYLVWILLFIPLLALVDFGKKKKRIQIAFLILFILTFLIFPCFYDLLSKKNLLLEIMLLARNLLVLIIGIMLLVQSFYANRPAKI